MAIEYLSGNRISGLSTDTKPTNAPEGAIFYETNTKTTYDMVSSTWVERTAGLSASDNVTVDGKTQSLADWLILQKTIPTDATSISAVADGKTTATVSWTQKETDKVSATKVDYQRQAQGSAHFTDDFSSDNFTHNDSNKTSVSSDKFNWEIELDNSDDTAYQPLGLTLDNTSWVMRFKINFDTLTLDANPGAYGKFCLSSSSAGASSSFDWIGFERYVSSASNTWNLGYGDGTSGNTATDGFTTTPAASSTYYMELIRDGATITGKMFTGSDYSTGLVDTTTLTMTGTVENLTHFKFFNRNDNTQTGQTATGSLEDLRVYNGQTTVNDVPQGSWTQATATATGTSHQVTGLAEDGDYLFRVYPSNIMGQVANATTLGSSINTWTAPTIPQGLTAVADPNNSEGIYVSWSASTAETPTPVTAITYTLERSPNGSSDWTAIQTGITTTNYLDSTNTIATRYYYRVKSVNSADSSGYSNVDDHLVPDNPVTGYGNATKNADGNLTGYDYYKYTTAGTSSFVVDDTAEVRVLVVGGGGSGGGTHGKGGGAGGLVWTDAYNLSAGTYTVTVGAGNGGTSSFDSTSATGGGSAGGNSGAGTIKSGLTGTVSTAKTSGGNATYAGGGGAGAQFNGQGAGGHPSGHGGGKGGDGYSITGMEFIDQYYGGGGGGGAGWNSGVSTQGQGGQGGGGTGARDNGACGSAGTNGTGGGGGAHCSPAGGTGIVLIRVTM